MIIKFYTFVYLLFSRAFRNRANQDFSDLSAVQVQIFRLRQDSDSSELHEASFRASSGGQRMVEGREEERSPVEQFNIS